MIDFPVCFPSKNIRCIKGFFYKKIMMFLHFYVTHSFFYWKCHNLLTALYFQILFTKLTSVGSMSLMSRYF